MCIRDSIGPGGVLKADIGGILHVVREVRVVYMFRHCAACVLHCMNGDEVKARVFSFGVRDQRRFRAWCRYLRANRAW